MEAPTTNVRHRVIGVCSLMAVLLYLDRYCISFAEIYIKEDLGLSNDQIGWMISAFFWTYALGQVFAGWMSDRFGGRKMLTIYVLAWSLFTAATGLANGFVMLMALRFGFGAAQAGAYPTASNLISKWVPVYRRGFASSIVAMGGRIGGSLALLLTGYVIVYLVPPSTSSRFEVRDVLEPERFCYELVYGEALPNDASTKAGPAALHGQRILEQFPTYLSELVREHAAQYRASLLSKQEMPGQLQPSQLTAIVQELNGILGEPNFFLQEQLIGVRIENEAQRLWKQEHRSALETERINRLVLESLYRNSLRKIYGKGWRSMIMLYGAIGLVVAAWIWWVVRDSPRNHPGVNEAELSLIHRGKPSAAASQATVEGIPVRELVGSPSMWLNGLMQAFTNLGWVFLVTATPRYFAEYHQVPVEARSWLTAIPTWAAMAGMFSGGIVTDRLMTMFGKRWGRSAIIAVTRFISAAAYLLCLSHPSVTLAVIAFSIAAFSCDLGIPAVWAYQQDVGGKYAGSVLGWGNMFGNFGAALGPPLFFKAIGEGQNWDRAFLTCAIAFAISGIAALGINAARPLFPESE